MPTQTDNIAFIDLGTGITRTLTAGDDVELSYNFTLTSGAILVADNLKRNAGDPNGSVAGNIGDALFRTDNGQFYVNTDGTNTGWQNISATNTLAETLAAGNSSGGTNLQMTSGDSIVGEDNAVGSGGDLILTAGSSGGGGGNGGSITLSPGTPSGGSNGIVTINGQRHYPASATDPTSPTPAAGDIYYNTAINKEMRYDASRTKWLSSETVVLQFGRNGNVGTNTFYRGINGAVLSATRGWPAIWNGTIVAFGYTRSDTDAANFEVVDAGTTLVTIASSANLGTETTTNTDFNQNAILAVRNGAGNQTSNVQGWVHVKWRP